MNILVRAYFVKNLGDDLFVKILCNRYPQHQFNYITNRVYTETLSPNLKEININSVSSIIFRGIIKINNLLKINHSLTLESKYLKYQDLIVTIGGSLFMETDQANYNTWKNKIKRGYSKVKCPIYILGVNVGPYKTQQFIELLKNQAFKKVEDICLRDEYSYNLFKELKNVRKANDIVFSLNNNKPILIEENMIIISVINCKKRKNIDENNKYTYQINKLVQYFVQKNYKVVLMSFCSYEGDDEVVKELVTLANNSNVTGYYYDGNIDEALELLGKAKIIVGTRFHANIIGLAYEKTVIPICYSDKMKNVLEDIDFKGKYYTLKEFLEIEEFNFTEEELNYKLPIQEIAKDAENHFKMLDKILNKSEEK